MKLSTITIIKKSTLFISDTITIFVKYLHTFKSTHLEHLHTDIITIRTTMTYKSLSQRKFSSTITSSFTKPVEEIHGCNQITIISFHIYFDTISKTHNSSIRSNHSFTTTHPIRCSAISKINFKPISSNSYCFFVTSNRGFIGKITIPLYAFDK